MLQSVSKWHKKFTKGQEDVKDNVGSGQPKTHQIDGYIDRVCLLVHSNRQLSVQVMVDDLELVKEVVGKILTADAENCSQRWCHLWILHHNPTARS